MNTEEKNEIISKIKYELDNKEEREKSIEIYKVYEMLSKENQYVLINMAKVLISENKRIYKADDIFKLIFEHLNENVGRITPNNYRENDISFYGEVAFISKNKILNYVMRVSTYLYF